MPKRNFWGVGMVVFLVSALFAFLLYECLAYAEIPFPRKGWFRIGGVTISFSQTSAVWWRYGLCLGIIAVIVLCIILAHDGIGRGDRLSRSRINITLGFLFGPLFAIWLNGIFRSPPGTPLSRSQMLGGLGLIAFCIVGSAGDEAGKLLRRWAYKANALKGFGLEISMASDPTRRKDLSQGASPPAGNKSFPSARGSTGLTYLAGLDDIIGRDTGYIRLLAGQPSTQLLEALTKAQGFAHDAITPPLACLVGWVDANADATLVNDHVSAFVRVFRQIPTLTDRARRIEIGTTFVRNMATIAADVTNAGAPEAVTKACAPLLKIFCQLPAGPDPPPQTRAAQIDCIRQTSRWASSSNAAAPAEAADHIAEISQHLAGIIDEKGLETRPYFAIAHASLMAQLGQYDAAMSILYAWLDQDETQRKKRSSPDVAADWLALRARSILAAYFEEWILSQGSTTATVLRNEHLANLDVLRAALARILTQADFVKADPGQSTPVIGTPGPCRAKATADLDLWQKLYTSYVSMELTQIQNWLRHPQYPEHAEATRIDTLRLLNRDLSCLSSFPPPDLLYAQILDTYAHGIVLYAKARNDTDSSDAEASFKLAERAVSYGRDITKKQSDLDLNRTGGTYLSRITQSDYVATRESLGQTLLELKAVRED